MTVPCERGLRRCGVNDIDPRSQVRSWRRLVYCRCGVNCYTLLPGPKGCHNGEGYVVHSSRLQVQQQILGWLKVTLAVSMLLLAHPRGFQLGQHNWLKPVNWLSLTVHQKCMGSLYRSEKYSIVYICFFCNIPPGVLMALLVCITHSDDKNAKMSLR